MKTLLIIDAGHSSSQEGAHVNGYHENLETIKIRDCLKPLLEKYNVLYVPDNLDLKDSITWVNARATPDSFALAIHLNNNNDPTIRGTEGYHAFRQLYSNVFSKNVALALGIPNRGSKHDSISSAGSLGWLRKLNCPSTLIECCYLSNKEDMKVFTPMGAAIGIKHAIEELFPLSVKVEDINIKKIGLLRLLIEKMLQLIGILRRRM